MDDVSDVFAEAVLRAKDNGAVDQAAWDSIVDEVVEEFRTDGRIHDDEDTDGLAEDLRNRFGEYEDMVRQQGL